MTQSSPAPSTQPAALTEPADALLRAVPPQVVQSIRAFRIPELQQAAVASGQHFLYAHLAQAHTRAEVLEQVGQQFHFPPHYGKNFDALYDCLTDSLHNAGQQPGFVVVLDQVPVTAKFDKDLREQFIDCFRDAADFWAEHQIPFRCFYSYL
jgi:RNAse (barnase) inhibitor barstar